MNEALTVIALAQQDNGSFESVAGPAGPGPVQTGRRHQTTFFTSVILGCLSYSDYEDEQVNKIRERAVNFLLAQKSPAWSFNYWQRQAPEFTALPYPDDLDDTFAALGALAAARPDLISGQVLARAVQLLLAAEARSGGPYKTWLVPAGAPAVWQDVDLAVNANIAWFLLGQKVQVPELARFIEQRIRGQNYHSPYYPSPYPVIYFLSRGDKAGALSKDVQEFLLARQALGHNPLMASAAISSLLRWGLPAPQLRAWASS